MTEGSRRQRERERQRGLSQDSEIEKAGEAGRKRAVPYGLQTEFT